MVDVVSRTAEQVFIPFTVGGGVRAPDDARRLLRAGADKVALNTAAVADPAACRRAGRRVRIAVRRGRHRRPPPRCRRRGGRSSPTADGARRAPTPWRGRSECAALGAGEILVTSMDRDGTRHGFDVELTRAIVDTVGVPVVASGGVGNSRAPRGGGDATGGADAVLAASIFHRQEYTVAEAKDYLAAHGVVVRPPAPELRRAASAVERPAPAASATVRPWLRAARQLDPPRPPRRPKQPIIMLADRVLAQQPGGRGGAAVTLGHPHSRHRAGVAPAAVGRGGGRRARTSGRSRWVTRSCSTPRTDSRSRSRATST